MINISIVLFNAEYNEVNDCINSLITSEAINKIYLIDNSATNYLSALSSQSQKIEYIHNDSNLGFGRAHNIAIKNSITTGTRYHLILNADCYFDVKILDELMSFMDANQNIGLVSPKIYYPNNRLQTLCKLLPTPAVLFFRRFLPTFLSRSINKNYELHDFDYARQLDVPSLSGCFMFLRTNSLKIIGLFDEIFFLYAEDLDLCRRMNEKFRTVFYPNVFIYHKYNKGSYKKLNLMVIHMLSMIRYFNKWGWFFDSKRSKINKEVVNTINEHNTSNHFHGFDNPK